MSYAQHSMQLDVLFCELCTSLCMHLCVWRSLGLYMCVHRCWADHYQTASKVYKVFQHVNCTVLCWWWCFCFFSFTCLHCTLVVYFIFYRKRAICYFMSTWRGLKRSIHYLLSVWMYNWIASITVNEKKKKHFWMTTFIWPVCCYCSCLGVADRFRRIW